MTGSWEVVKLSQDLGPKGLVWGDVYPISRERSPSPSAKW
jgi:hypothetical protein